MKPIHAIPIAGLLAAAMMVPAHADPVIFLGRDAYVDDVPAHVARRPLRGRGTYNDPYVYEDGADRYDDYVPYDTDDAYLRPLRPRQIARMLRARGFHSFSDVERFRAIFGVSATDPHGNRVRLAVDARTGEIRHTRLLRDGRDYGRARDYDDYDDEYIEPAPTRTAPLITGRSQRSTRRIAPIDPPRARPARETASVAPGTPSAPVRTAAVDPVTVEPVPARTAPAEPAPVHTASIRPLAAVPPLPKARPDRQMAVGTVPARQNPAVSAREPAPTEPEIAVITPPAAPAAPATEPPAADEQAAAPKKPVVTYKPPVSDYQDPEIGQNPLVIY